ncbi:hypothetical protein NXG27_07405 [Megasphaera paucivorans]|uniref:Uncharacterized protein n=1 Tax=Megasphaera paucivorans TaxID=349095 RepID=A0A1G9WWX7_9FIRM|nr:hypothetical protein [Megasphaera paucivorans]SDM88977.1 hypothetical protein SAMN05660299_01699 [Megasphaera paucivorans]
MSKAHSVHYGIYISFMRKGGMEIVKSLGSFDFSGTDKVPKEISDYLMRDTINLGLYNNNDNEDDDIDQ